MATLFFDGFDRGTVLGRLDPQHWSTQYKNDPGYSLAGYSYDHNNTNYSNQYKISTINNPTSAPSGQFFGYYIADDGGSQRIAIPGNHYPAFGTAPGFLALANVPINDTNFLAPLTYIQLSGFSQPLGKKTYFGARFMGLETKHTSYDSRIDPTRVDKPGRFDYRHPLLAFCSGNITGLLLSVVRATGNNLSLLENQKITMGLQIEQNGQTLGIFDLNLNDTINQYQVGSYFRASPDSYWNTVYGNSGVGNAILGIGHTLSHSPSNYFCSNCNRIPITAFVSRWTHLEFLINNDAENSYISAKIEGVDLPVIDPDDTNSDKETWPLEIPISGFNYDNIRFYNRTYYKDVFPYFLGDPNNGLYYAQGAVTLVDDITLIDDVGQPGFWLGPTAKVLPLSPGIGGNLDNNANISDGLREWSTNSSSHRRALKNFDGDVGVLETTVSGAITAVRYDNHNFGPDSSSAWRTEFNDGIAGIKIYNNARKNFLDTQFTNVFFTGISDNQAIYTQLLINTDRDIYDVTNKNTLSKIEPISLSYGIQKFDDPSIYFPNNESYLYMPYGNLHRSESSEGFPYPHPDNFFTIESWVYFQNGNESITLYSKKPPTSYPQIADFRLDIPSTNFDIVCTTGYIQYSTYIDDELLGYRRMHFPQGIPTGTWNHVALVNDAIQDFRGTLINNVRYYNHQYRLVSYLNGVSGTTHAVWNNLDNNLSVYTTNGNPYGWSPSANSYSTSVNLDFGSNISGVSVITTAGAVSGLGNNLSPITGLFQEYFPSIKIPDNSTWQDRINYPQTITVTNLNYYYDGNYTYSGFIEGKPFWLKTSGYSDGSQRSIRWYGGLWFLSYHNQGFNYGGYRNNSDTAVPPIRQNSVLNGGWYEVGMGGINDAAQITYSLPSTNIPDLIITNTRCNNKNAYLITQAALPEMTGLYCYGGVYNNAYYYVNVDNPIYYLLNPYWYPWSSNDSNRRWIISSGLVDAGLLPVYTGIKYVCSSANISTDNIVSVSAQQTAHMRIITNGNNNSNTVFTIVKNNIDQRNLTRNSDGVLSGVLGVVSGDVVSIRASYQSYPNLSTNPSLSINLSLSSSAQDGHYYLPTEYLNNGRWNFSATFAFNRPSTIVGKFTDEYTDTSSNTQRFPLFIGGGGHIDNYRFTHGTSYTQGLPSRTRYWQNFDIIDAPFPSVYDDYYQVGNIHTLTRTRYNTIQYYSMINPATQQPWTTELIETSGFLFGVKKL
jgi:hypothetical protein